MSVNPYIIRWYHSFLTNRTQQVRVNQTTSQSKVISTGVPQGCVSSPPLFTVYTNDCISRHPSVSFIKFSDDTAILCLMDNDTNTLVYKQEVNNFVRWCEDHHLTVNTKKTEEMVFDPGHVGDHTLLLIQDANIAQVDSYKYLGVHIDNNLSWSVHVNSVCSRIQQRLHFLRRLRVFGVQRKVMLLFYR